MTRLRSLIKEVLSTPPKKKDCNCGCGGCGKKAPVLTENKVKSTISEGLQYHIDKKVPLHESVYRIGSEKHFALINEARALWVRELINVSEDDQAILETHLGNFGLYEGEEVPLDLPMVSEGKDKHSVLSAIERDIKRGYLQRFQVDEDEVYAAASKLGVRLEDGEADEILMLLDEPLNEVKNLPNGDVYLGQDDKGNHKVKSKGKVTLYNNEDMVEIYGKGWGHSLNEAKKKAKSKKKDPPLNKPKRGGSKAYYVYVRDPKTKKIKKVSFGSGGLRAKIKNKDARKAFAARHNCDKKKDRTKAGYWSCNLPRYAEQLGLGSKMNTFW